MPTFELTIQGKSYHVEIPDPDTRPLKVVVDGQPFDVGIAGTAAPARPAQPPQEASRPAPEAPVSRAVPRANAARPVAPAAPGGGGEITSPMPGTLISIGVKVGDAIQAGQVVCVLEAMKMRNAIRARASGTVSEILASVGQSVAHGDVLVRLTTGG